MTPVGYYPAMLPGRYPAMLPGRYPAMLPGSSVVHGQIVSCSWPDRQLFMARYSGLWPDTVVYGRIQWFMDVRTVVYGRQNSGLWTSVKEYTAV